jgi:putative NIF3 family GTP cyclohydrolase 1 type 2
VTRTPTPSAHRIFEKVLPHFDHPMIQAYIALLTSMDNAVSASPQHSIAALQSLGNLKQRMLEENIVLPGWIENATIHFQKDLIEMLVTTPPRSTTDELFNSTRTYLELKHRRMIRKYKELLANINNAALISGVWTNFRAQRAQQSV